MIEKTNHLKQLYQTIEEHFQNSRLGSVTDCVTSLFNLGDWKGIEILERVKRIQEAKWIDTGYVDFLIKQNSRFRIIGTQYPDGSNLRDILLHMENICPYDLLNVIQEADYSHPLNAFEYVLKRARDNLTDERKHFLQAYGRELGISDTGIGFFLG